MIQVQQIYNRIFKAGLALLLAAGLLQTTPVYAAETTDPVKAVEGTAENYAAKTIVLPFKQSWTGGGDHTVTYALTPRGAFEESGYTFNTEQDVANGNISWETNRATSSNPGTITLNDSSSSANISFTWGKAGLYEFDLKATTTDRSNYTYDRTTYRIRVYVRSDTHFITVQNLSNADKEDQGKVGNINFQHTYTEPANPGGGGDGGGDSGGGGSTPSTPSNNTTPTSDGGSNVVEISDSGSVGLDGIIQDVIESITEWGDVSADPDANGNYVGNHSNSYTGDDSHMILYGFISILAIITLTVWLIHHKRA